MIQIAVVDDENIICEQLSELLKKYQCAHKMMFHISIYHTGENLLADMDDGMIFDLILLDIELAKINGVQVGTYIRNIQNTKNKYTVHEYKKRIKIHINYKYITRRRQKLGIC